MSSKRPAILMVILLVLVAGLVAHSMRDGAPASRPESPAVGRNAVSDVEVRKGPDGRWVVSVAYDYSGEPGGATVRVFPVRAHVTALPPDAAGSAVAVASSRGDFRPALPGSHRVDIELSRPIEPALAYTTTRVAVEMQAGQRVLATRHVEQSIAWPDWSAWLEARSQVGKTPDDLLREAVAAIDIGNRQSLAEARRILERLIARDAQYEPAFIELARVAMKTNWGPEGLRQAESHLSSARQINPDSVSAKILLGYVYAHQKRYKEAESLFADAARAEPPNLWLWANWGQALVMQGRVDEGIEKYRMAITRPRTLATYDRARLDAYWNLLRLMEERGDTAAVESLHKQRLDDFGAASCFGVEYARFLLRARGDTAAAQTLARQAIDSRCGDDDARRVLGLALYTDWSGAPGSESEQLLRQARVYYPAGAGLWYELASSENGLVAAKALKAAGEPIDLTDSRGYNALAYALERSELATARRLLRLGAKADTLLGPEKMPVALVPVVVNSIDGIRLMQEFGVDYGRLQFQGMTAIDHAKRVGDQRLLEALDRNARRS